MAQVAIAKHMNVSQCFISGFLMRYYMMNNIYTKKNFPRPKKEEDLFKQIMPDDDETDKIFEFKPLESSDDRVLKRK